VKKGRCYICGSYSISEEHHLIPQSRGGEDGPTINLCVEHHKKAHYLAISKKHLREIVNPKLRKIVQIIRIANKTSEHSNTVKITIEIPRTLYNLIKEEANTGVKRSISKMILLILVRHFKEKVR
jgi:hypothetical protein